MITQIKNLLSHEQLTAINTLIDQGQFEDGRLTAGWNAKSVKDNRQWTADDNLMAELNHYLSQTLGRPARIYCRHLPQKNTTVYGQ